MLKPQLPDAYIGFRSLAIGGYRSFGALQRFERFAKVNILIGQNNCGKSNVLRFIRDKAPTLQTAGLSAVGTDAHTPGATPRFGITLGTADETAKTIREKIGLPSATPASMTLEKLFQGRADSLGQVWFDYEAPAKPLGDWSESFAKLEDRELQQLWSSVTHQGSGDRKMHWEPETLLRIQPLLPAPKVVLVPAFRQVGPAGSSSEGFDGVGIIERLAQLQNPSIDRLADKVKFQALRDFVRAVLSNPRAEIDIPYARDTIHVALDGKAETIDSLGTGIHEVIILAAAATVLDECVICMEEPELHLNPLLQKKLMRHLIEYTTNQYFIATHSASLMDTQGAEVYHLSLASGATQVERVTSDRHRSAICADLGYHPSDLLQANCIVWVEGPSDRIYLQWWIASMDPALIEGIHYSIMFYGGRLASHLTADDDAASEFIKLRRLNRHGAIMMDSDRERDATEINSTKKRLQIEFDVGPGHAFITAGREVENYVDPDLLKRSIIAVHPTLELASNLNVFENALLLKSRGGGTRQADKVRVAHKVIELAGSPAFDRLDLQAQVEKMVRFIRLANPPIET